MRYLKTLLVSLLALVGTSAFAQTWTGNEAAAGTYYLYNVGTGKWLCGGNNWGTHASVADYGIDFILAGSNGAYTLDSQLSNGGNSHFLNGEWCDGASMSWTFTQVKTEDGAIAYTIGNGQQFLTANTSDTNVNLKGNEGALSQWILVSKADIAQAALDAKATDVVDVTGFIIGQRTSRNNTRAQVTGDRQLFSNNNVWKMERDADGRWCQFAMNGAGGNGSAATPYAIEAWNWKSFNFYQDITEVPNGKYTLHVNSFYRGHDGIRGYVYANDAMSPLTAETDAYKSYGAGNDLRNAAAAFYDGKYDNSVDVTVTNGSIRVGVKQMDAPGGDWMPFANFRLEYKGMAPLLENAIDKASELIPTLDEQNAAGLQEAVDAAQAVYDNPDATNAEIQEAIQALQDAYNDADALNIAKNLAKEVLAGYDSGKYAYAWKEKYVDPLRELLAKCESGEEFDTDEMVAELTRLARGVVTTHSWAAQLYLQGDEHVNPSADYDWMYTFDEYFGAWTNEGWGEETLSDEPMTDYNGAQPLYIEQESEDGFKADIYQDIFLPAGRYILTATGRGTANAFTEVGAQDPAKYFQVYAINDQGVDRRMSIPTEGFGKSAGIFGYGWNDASIMFTMKSDGVAKIGVRAATDQKAKASVSNFRLARLGDATLYFNELESYGDQLAPKEVYNYYKQYEKRYGPEIADMFFGSYNCPADVLLRKEMQADKWYSIAVPAYISEEQIAAQFGEGTRLAWPVYGYDLEDGSRVLNFWSWDVSDPEDENRVTNGMLANLPYLIKPAKTKQSHRYSFNNVEVGNSPDATFVYWPLGYNVDEEMFMNSLIWLTDNKDHVTFHVNYDYQPKFPEYYTIEFCDTLKAFTAYVTTDGEGEILPVVDDELDILFQQVVDALNLGQQKATWYPGIPAAMTKVLTTVPELNYLEDYMNALKNIKATIIEAQKAYEPSKKFNALMAQAKELLASDHNELVEGADAAFQKKIERLQKRFDALLKAAPIDGLTEERAAAIAEYKEQIFIAGTLEAGNYILQNVATGKYYGGANSWGTRASLTDHPEYVTLAKLEDGAYTIESRYSNGEGQNFLGSNYFVDNGNPMALTITPVGEGIYTINCTGDEGTGFLGYDGSTTVLSGVLADGKSEAAQWRITSVEDLVAAMPEASVDNPQDVTFLIKDANFGRNNRDAAAWIWETENHNIAGANENFCAESWTHTFVLSQEIELPNGVYMLNAQAALTDYTGAYDKRADYPVVYANNESVQFCEMEEDDRATSMNKLSGSFSAGKYFVDPIILEVTDGKMTIGAKCDATDYWCIFDNFSLTYFADADIEAVRAKYPKSAEGTTGINEVNVENANNAIYNLNGVRMNNMNQKGVYIVNGKKVTK